MKVHLLLDSKDKAETLFKVRSSFRLIILPLS